MTETQIKSKKASSGKKILVVEDEKPLAHALQLKFTHDGFEVDTATNGREGLEMALKNKYDAILLDLIMPHMDGFSFLQELKDKKIKTPILVLSNLGQSEDKERAKELGAVNYYVKSNTPIADIISAVHSEI